MTDYALLESGEREKKQCELEPEQSNCLISPNVCNVLWFILMFYYSCILIYQIHAMQALAQQIERYNNANDGIPD